MSWSVEHAQPVRRARAASWPAHHFYVCARPRLGRCTLRTHTAQLSSILNLSTSAIWRMLYGIWWWHGRGQQRHRQSLPIAIMANYTHLTAKLCMAIRSGVLWRLCAEIIIGNGSSIVVFHSCLGAAGSLVPFGATARMCSCQSSLVRRRLPLLAPLCQKLSPAMARA